MIAVAPAMTTGVSFVCDQSQLSKAVSFIKNIIPLRPPNPVLGCLLLTADSDNDKITLTGYDLYRGLKLQVPATVQSSGSIAIPGKLFADIIERLSGALEIEVSQSTINITAQTGTYSIQGMSDEDYPSLPDIKGATIWHPSGELKQLLDSVLFAASADPTKQILNGVHITSEGRKIEAAATDGHRLARCRIFDELEAIDMSDALQFTASSKAVVELIRILPNSDDVATITFDNDFFSVSHDDFYLVGRCHSGQYPQYQFLIPSSFEHSLTLDRKQLIDVLSRIEVIATEKGDHIIHFDFDLANDHLKIKAECQDVGKCQETMTCQSYQAYQEGESFLLAFNIKYLMQSLKNMTSTEVIFRMNTPTSPVIVEPLGGLNELHLIMPVQIRS